MKYSSIWSWKLAFVNNCDQTQILIQVINSFILLNLYGVSVTNGSNSLNYFPASLVYQTFPYIRRQSFAASVPGDLLYEEDSVFAYAWVGFVFTVALELLVGCRKVCRIKTIVVSVCFYFQTNPACIIFVRLLNIYNNFKWG